MKSTPRLFLLLPLVLFGLSTGRSSAQSIAEALETPGLTWSFSGPVAALNDPMISLDGVDVVRLDVPTIDGLYPSIKTTVSLPSVVEFWHRSEDFELTATLGRNSQAAYISGPWKHQRLLQWPAGWGNQGELEFSNRGEKGSTAIYLDKVSLRTAGSTGFAEALDFPGFVPGAMSAVSAVPLAEGWLSPDGIDAVVFPSGTAHLPTVFQMDGMISFRSAGGDTVPAVVATPSESDLPLPFFVLGDRTWAWVRTPGNYQFRPGIVSGKGPVLNSQTPVVMDALEELSSVPLKEALDAPNLTFAVTGIAAGCPAPAGASDGDGVLCLDQSQIGSGSSIIVNVDGPGVVRFSYLGGGRVQRKGEASSQSMPYSPLTWRTMEVPVYRSGETITWSTFGSFWLDAVSVLPPSPESSLAGLLNAPSLDPQLLVPAYVGPAFGKIEGDSAAEIVPLTSKDLQPVVRIPFEGASMISLLVQDIRSAAQVRIDGGAWQSPTYSGSVPFTALAPGPGPHTLEVTGPVVLDQLKIIPLIPLPLPEALDAPEMTFTTSPGLPWLGYRMPTGNGYLGDHAATGGIHSIAGDPWIETRLTGPGVLKFTTSLTAYARTLPGHFIPSDSLLQQFLDGVNVTSSEIWIPEGEHILRWVQKGSQIQNGTGTLAFLDAVSFTPKSIVSLGAALDTPNRAWTSAGTVTTIMLPRYSWDGVDSVMMDGVLSPAWLETTVNLPSIAKFGGRQVQISVGGGPGLIPLKDTSIFGNFRLTLSGNGPARVRFTALAANSLLDTVDFEQDGGRLLPEITLNTAGLRWRQYGDLPWRVIPNESDGTARYRGLINTKIWMETVAEGPCRISPTGSAATLPEHGNRPIYDGWIPYPGPQRVLVAIPANTLVSRDSYLASPPIRDWSAIPGLTWSTGGEVPWQRVDEQKAQSGFVWPGETSWLEAEANGPGVLTWKLTFPNTTMVGHVLCDGVAVPFLTEGKIHIGSGLHRIRWQVANPRNGLRTIANPMRLEAVNFVHEPVDSFSQILSNGTLSFAESVSIPPRLAWQITDDPSLPGKALRGNFHTSSLTPLPPLPGRFGSSLKMTGAREPYSFYPTGVAAAAPFPWSRTTVGSPPQTDGFETFFAKVSWTPPTPVSVGEAVDLPELAWNAGSSPPGLWQALAAPNASNDPDGLYLVGAQMGHSAFLETGLTGPLNLTTELTKPAITSVGMRLSVDGHLAVTDRDLELLTDGAGTASPALSIPAGTHVVRWEFAPPVPLLGNLAPVLRRITTSPPSSSLPDVPALLDNPELKWNVIGGNLAGVSPGANGGVDALVLHSNSRINFPLSGPGIASFYAKTENPEGKLDDLLLSSSPDLPSDWVLHQIPIPSGPHTLSLNGYVVLDQFFFTPLPSLTMEEALDAPPGVTVTIEDATLAGAAAYGAMCEDGEDCLMLITGASSGISISVPPLSTITFRYRSVFGYGSSTWNDFTHSTAGDGGLSTFHFRAGAFPLLLDSLTVAVPPAFEQYFPWATAAGLAVNQQDIHLDVDSDGMNNFTEYSFGLNPMVADPHLTGTDTMPGLPSATLFTATDGQQYMEIRFWHRNIFNAKVETATQPSATALLGESGGWTTSNIGYTSTNRPEGWVRVVWRSPSPITPEQRTFARVRAHIP